MTRNRVAAIDATVLYYLHITGMLVSSVEN